MASYSALPEPMLARSGRLPACGDFAYEVKWDGFRAIVSTEGELRVRSRRGWDMTEHVGFLAELPVRAVLDGELVALDENGKPDFPSLCEGVLQRAPRGLAFAGGTEAGPPPISPNHAAVLRKRSFRLQVGLKLRQQLRMLAQDPGLPAIALLPGHRRHVQRIHARGLVRRLLELTPVDKLDISNRRSRRFPGIPVLEAAPKGGQHSRKVIVQRGRCALSDTHPCEPAFFGGFSPACDSDGAV